MSVKYYRDILELDATDMESIACIGLHHFYSDQPEVALRYYRLVYNFKNFVHYFLLCLKYNLNNIIFTGDCYKWVYTMLSFLII